MNYFQITAFVNRLKQNKTMSTITELKKELEQWKNTAPVNGMGAYARQTKIDALTEKIKSLEVKNQKKNERYCARNIKGKFKILCFNKS